MSTTRETDPVDPVERVLRRIHENDYYAEKPVPFARTAFSPSPADVDGLSFFRSGFTTCDALDRAARKPGHYYIVELEVRELMRLDLSLVPDPRDSQPDGHCFMPEIG